MVEEIASGARSGGANTSHTIVVAALRRVIDTVGRHAGAEEYERAVVDDNVLGKDTAESRQRTLRYLRELYLLRPDSILFRALRDLWTDDPAGQPLLAGLCALARDPAFRGLTFVVEFAGLPDGATVDLRTQAGDAGSSVAELGRVTGGAGKVILLVEDDDLEGQPVQLVVVAADGALLLQRETTVGQNR